MNHVAFRVYIEQSLENEKLKILKALSMIPNFFSFEFKDWSEADYFVYDEGDWENFVMPTTDNTIIFFDGDSREINYAGGTLGTRIGVAVFDYDTIESIYLRTYHELLHTLGLPADDMTTNREFVQWLSKMLRLALFLDKKFFYEKFIHNPKWQNIYYDFLLIKYLEGGGNNGDFM